MASSYQGYVSNHFVSLNRFDNSIESVLSRTLSLVDKQRDVSVLPTIIGIDVEYNAHPDAFKVARAFLKKFRKIQQNHFVRFVTDTLWAMESDNGDVFYTHDGPKEDWCDIVWNLKIVNDQQVEISLTLPIDKERNFILDDLTNTCKSFVPGNCHPVSERELINVIHDFRDKARGVDGIGYLKGNFHLLLIPTSTHIGYYPVAIYGMNYADAKRRNRQVLNQQEYNRRKFYEIFTDPVTPEENFYTLFSLIRENDRVNLMNKSVIEAYSLAEYLFGVYASYVNKKDSKHDIILFDMLDKNRNMIDAFCYNV